MNFEFSLTENEPVFLYRWIKNLLAGNGFY